MLAVFGLGVEDLTKLNHWKESTREVGRAVVLKDVPDVKLVVTHGRSITINRLIDLMLSMSRQLGGYS